MKRIIFLIFTLSISLPSLSAPPPVSASGSQIWTTNSSGRAIIRPGYGPGIVTNLTIHSNLFLAATTSASNGVVMSGSDTFIHTFAPVGGPGQNTFVGRSAGNTSISRVSGDDGSYNNAVGDLALHSLTTGSYNSAHGPGNLSVITTNHWNSAYGSGSMPSLLYGDSNTGCGADTMYYSTNSQGCSAFGHFALMSNQSIHNSGGGAAAMANLIDGAYNTAWGAFSGFSGTHNSNNVYLGYQAGYWSTENHKLFIDNDGRGNEANGKSRSLIYGNFDASPANQWVNINGALNVATTATATNGFINGVSAVKWIVGSGNPENVVTAPVGSLYSRTDGGAGTSLYVKESGTGSTGWVGK